jgi:YHS domain-containing protein
MIIRLLRFLLFFGIAYFIYKVIWKGESLFSKKRKRQASQKAIEEMKKDPVCGTYIPVNQAVKHRINGTVYYFCSNKCKEEFQKLNK